MLIGNKTDLEGQREVRKAQGEEYAKKHNLLFTETSAKTADQVEEAFILTAMAIYERIKLGELDVARLTETIKVRMDQHAKPQTSWWNCC
ncbi:unnamed protein product [Allacma fusca]|uniref:Uncharacterized protein n=1 Tax=Allacma fusca TaxID=39272 RepID=A0A8J2JAT3_9HEXA|nr:unnamed protein product [Allacma fusca]